MPDADDDLLGATSVLLGERVAQIERFGIAVPSQALQLVAHRAHRFGRRTEGALVGAEPHQLA